MTCAGLLGLAVGYGVINDRANEKGKPRHELSKDVALRGALLYLALSIGTPLERRPGAPPLKAPGAVPAFGGPAGGPVGDRTYYFLWSLERVAVVFNLDTIGKKDWYGWGCDLLVLTQKPNGTWVGQYGEGGVDTCFALLFLRRANLASDLSKLTGRIEDPGQRVIRSGGVGGGALSGLKKGSGNDDPDQPGSRVKDPGDKSGSTPQKKSTFGDSPGAKLAEALVNMSEEQQSGEIERLRDERGADKTEALATAIPYLAIEPRRKAREALARREARMKVETIGRDLHDENPEIRRAAVSACAFKETKQFVPELIELLSDPKVARTAYAALKDLTGQDFGPSVEADETAKKQASASWLKWWQKQPK
jgi:hypothetical protein